MKDQFLVRGLAGRKILRGELPVRGAKNDVLKAMAAAILFEDSLGIGNVPAIEDVGRTAELLSGLGASVERRRREVRIDARGISRTDLDPEIATRLRASIVLTGPLLARFKSVALPHPGGDVIGPRPIDLFLKGFRKMGASVEARGKRYALAAPRSGLAAADIFFEFVSVTATETLMLAATAARGRTTLRNAALEPEIPHLAAFLNASGARIRGAGTSTITIDGPTPLRSRGKIYRTLPDRIEAGSFLILAALAGDEIEITRCNPEHIRILVELLAASGVPLEIRPRAVAVVGNGRKRNADFAGFNIRTHEYPGFPTDLQAIAAVYLTQVKSDNVIFETIFENRFAYANDLVKMGADITVWDPQRIAVKGPTPLSGRELEGPDIRAGLAYLVAAIVADGPSVINNVYHIDRGYERIEERLAAVGAPVIRVAHP